MSDTPEQRVGQTGVVQASFGKAIRPVVMAGVMLAFVTALGWLLLRFIFPGLSVLLAIALTLLSTLGGIAVIVSAGDGVPHQDRRAQDMVGVALVITMFGPIAALITLLIIMF